MTQPIKHILATTIIVTLTVLASVEALAFERPSTPLTGAFVSDIDNDWVELSIVDPDGHLQGTSIENLVDSMFRDQRYGSEVADLAHFSCNLYKREAVYLSYEYERAIMADGRKGLIVRARFLFACAIPAGM